MLTILHSLTEEVHLTQEMRLEGGLEVGNPFLGQFREVTKNQLLTRLNLSLHSVDVVTNIRYPDAESDSSISGTPS